MNFDLLATVELFRALGGDIRTPQELVFADELRPSVNFTNISVPQTVMGVLPLYKVTVPRTQMWQVVWAMARITSNNVGNEARIYASVQDPEGGQATNVLQGGQETTVVGAAVVQTVSPTRGPLVGWRPLVGVGGWGGDEFNNAAEKDNREFASKDVDLYSGSNFFIGGDNQAATGSGDLLQVRIRYHVMPQSFLDYFNHSAKALFSNPDPGTWGFDQSGVDPNP